MRMITAAALLAAFTCTLSAADKGVLVEWGSVQSTTPATWKEETPSNKMRLAQFKLKKSANDPADAELALFVSLGGGSIDANLQRQEKKFELAKGQKPKVTKVKVGKNEATYQDISGTYLKKFPPFDPNARVTKVEDYRQIYIIFEGKDSRGNDAVFSLTLLGPAKTVAAHKKDFDAWVKNFK